MHAPSGRVPGSTFHRSVPALVSDTLFGGGVSERPKEHASKACEGATPPWVQIPPPPPSFSGSPPGHRPTKAQRVRWSPGWAVPGGAVLARTTASRRQDQMPGALRRRRCRLVQRADEKLGRCPPLRLRVLAHRSERWPVAPGDRVVVEADHRDVAGHGAAAVLIAPMTPTAMASEKHRTAVGGSSSSISARAPSSPIPCGSVCGSRTTTGVTAASDSASVQPRRRWRSVFAIVVESGSDRMPYSGPKPVVTMPMRRCPRSTKC